MIKLPTGYQKVANPQKVSPHFAVFVISIEAFFCLGFYTPQLYCFDSFSQLSSDHFQPQQASIFKEPHEKHPEHHSLTGPGTKQQTGAVNEYSDAFNG